MRADEAFAGRDFEASMASRGATFLRPDRRDEKLRFGSPLPGLFARIGMRLLALSAGFWHDWELDEPGRHFGAYPH